MAGGYPSRLSRSALGPRLRNAWPVENPEIDTDAAAWNTLCDQAAGLNKAVIWRAAIAAAWNGTDFDVDYQEEAWNADGDQAHPALERTSTGVYTYTFAAAYDDAEGTSVSTELVAPRATSRNPVTTYASRVDGYAWVDPANPLVVQVRLFDGSGNPADVPFMLEVG